MSSPPKKENSEVKITTGDYASSGMKMLGIVGEATQNFLPLISSAFIVINEVNQIYDNAKYNTNICDSLMHRVYAAEANIKTLKRRSNKRSTNKDNYKTFLRFITVLENIRDFIKNVSSLQGYKRIFTSTNIKEKFEKLISDFESSMNDLHFTLSINNEEQRKIDQEGLEDDIVNMQKFLEKIEGNILDQNNAINTVLHEVKILKDRLDDPKGNPDRNIRANEINATELSDPPHGKSDDIRGTKEPHVVKRIYKTNEVACKFKEIPDNADEPLRIRTQLAILGKLRDSPYIVNFFGLSKIEGKRVMVFEWAEFGTLRELYQSKDIAWCAKVQLALDICRDVTCKMNNTMEIMRWMAPEKMKQTEKKQVRYTFKCEIFSFGMLLWELAFEKLPYEKMEADQIKEYVMKGGRERICWGEETPSNQKIQKGLENVIKAESQLRSPLQIIFLKLCKLAHKYTTLEKQLLFPDGTLNLDGSKNKLFTPEEDIISETDIRNMTFEAGLKAHKKEDKKHAWECFVVNSELGKTTAKYWQGYYLNKGYAGVKDSGKASQLVKEAADDGDSEAQLYYAFTFANPESFMEYLTKSADGGNTVAQHNLGIMYLNGKFQSVDEGLGLKYLRLAALNQHEESREILKERGIDIYK
ncbi:11053_t:CDS:2 [Diversispora eburnea]|uniref:11053_t:CDS:1 n=1 Tax=Diversispora eburnea TaxID=1213867 RepID=A0A9N8ZJT3_9GLOM|nr:11053_t:CDS:2 [Diversispora eburnea]